MLAKAVATEAGANFINISMSSITSKVSGKIIIIDLDFSVFSCSLLHCSMFYKFFVFLQWFGEGEKYVKAVFSLASKIAPSVVFVDEVNLSYPLFIIHSQYYGYLFTP